LVKRHYRLWLLFVIGILALGAAVFLGRRSGPRSQAPPAPDRPAPAEYSYYIIIEQQTGRTITYVSVPVTVGDEYLTSENKMYVVTRVVGNKAYARLK
jgi:hypothetical protein